MRKGYLSPAVILVLTAIIFFVALAFFLNSKLARNVKNGPTPSPQSITQFPSPSPKLDETANWKTYTSKSHKFSVEFPENWRLKENPAVESNDLTPFNDPAELILQSPENLDPTKNYTHGAGYGISFYTIRIDKGGKKLMEIINEQFANYGPGSKCVIQQAKVGEINGYKISNCFFGYTEAFYFESGALIQAIFTNYWYDEDTHGPNYRAMQAKTKTTVDRILSTFQFIE